MPNKYFLKIEEIISIFEIDGITINSSVAYNIIKFLNSQLKEKNYFTKRGMVSSKYFNENKDKVITIIQLKGV